MSIPKPGSSYSAIGCLVLLVGGLVLVGVFKYRDDTSGRFALKIALDDDEVSVGRSDLSERTTSDA